MYKFCPECRGKKHLKTTFNRLIKCTKCKGKGIIKTNHNDKERNT